MKTYHGSCHCGAVRFAAEIDLAAGTMRCNCTFCRKIRCWAVRVKPEHFKLIAGENEMSTYQFGARTEQHKFCRHCGMRAFGAVHPGTDREFFLASVSCLDDATVEELAAAPLRYIDGLNDNWDAPPRETSHL